MASADYISREAAKDAALEKIINNVVEDQGMYGYLCHLVDEVFDWLPAADVRPVVRASWEEKEKDGVSRYACSVCGEHTPKDRWGQEWHSNFCPNCGADMRSRED